MEQRRDLIGHRSAPTQLADLGTALNLGPRRAERRLVAEGETDLVVTIRRKFQTTMREDLVGGVELLTGRKVLSFMSDHDADHDDAAEVFILDGPPDIYATGESIADSHD